MRNVILAAAAMALIAGGPSLAMAQATQTAPSATTTAPGTSGATSGTSTGGMTSEAQVKKHLESEGYSNITGLKEEGGEWVAKAMHNGKDVMLNIDKTGKVIAK